MKEKKRNIFTYRDKDEMKELGAAIFEHEQWLIPKMKWLTRKREEEGKEGPVYVPKIWSFKEWYTQKCKLQMAEERALVTEHREREKKQKALEREETKKQKGQHV